MSSIIVNPLSSPRFWMKKKTIFVEVFSWATMMLFISGNWTKQNQRGTKVYHHGWSVLSEATRQGELLFRVNKYAQVTSVWNLRRKSLDFIFLRFYAGRSSTGVGLDQWIAGWGAVDREKCWIIHALCVAYSYCCVKYTKTFCLLWCFRPGQGLLVLILCPTHIYNKCIIVKTLSIGQKQCPI